MDVIGIQEHITKIKLPETSEALDMIASDTSYTAEFLGNIK